MGIIYNLFTFLCFLIFPLYSFGQGLITGINPNVAFEGTIGETQVKFEIELDLSGSGNFTGKLCGLEDFKQFGNVPDIWKDVNGHFNNETEEMTFDAYFSGSTEPYAKFKGMWGETSDGAGIFGEFKTLSVGQIEDVYLYEPE